MHDVLQKYLILNGNYLQSYKYFHHRKLEIRHLFNFSQKIKDSVAATGAKMFGYVCLVASRFVLLDPKLTSLLFSSDASHKLCVHIRRGDFLNHEQMESRTDFIEPAISFLHSNLTRKGISNISLIFLGTDYTFAEDLKFNRTVFSAVHIPRLGSRGEDLHFGIRFCDTLLISASGSTFAWWIGYLLPEGTQVFYNAQVSKNRNYVKDFYDFDFFPPDWNMLELNAVTKKVELDNRWFYERVSWPRRGVPPLF